MNRDFPHVPLQLHEYPADEMCRRARNFADELARRRTVRDFADRPVPREIIEAAIDAARHAPSGANHQPWHFAAICSPEVKHRIRLAA